MENFDINAYDFGTMTSETGVNPFEEKKSYSDERFYTLSKNSEGVGQAIIALLPDMHKNTTIKMLKLNTTIPSGKIKRWINTWSPRSIGLPCPFHETYINHYNEDPDTARKFRPLERYICNIKVIKDPANPENEGKIFLYDMSKTMHQKIKETLTITQAEIEMGGQRKEVFNPFKGWVLNLKCYRKDNNMISYDNSEFTQLPQGKTIYNLKGEPLTDDIKRSAVQELLTKTYDLSEFQKPENFKPYDELHKELERICGGIFGIGVEPSRQSTENININDDTSDVNVEVNAAPSESTQSRPYVQQTQVVPKPQEQKKDESLDDFLNSI